MLVNIHIQHWKLGLWGNLWRSGGDLCQKLHLHRIFKWSKNKDLGGKTHKPKKTKIKRFLTAKIHKMMI